jgi:hypothetical protein
MADSARVASPFNVNGRMIGEERLAVAKVFVSSRRRLGVRVLRVG